MKFKTFINEASSMVTIYHGDNYGTKKLDPKLMNNGNNQEGIGVYFGTLEVAKNYGKNIVSVTVNKKRFWGSRNLMSKHTNNNNVLHLFEILHAIDNEPLYYMITDWGIDVSEPEDVTSEYLMELAKKMITDEVRNFQITMAQAFGVVDFVDAWNKVFSNNLGTYNKDLDFYAIINPKVKLTKI